MSRCVHHLDLCPDCDGLRVTELANAADLGITNITINLVGQPSMNCDPDQAYFGPIEPCPNEEPTP